MEELIKPNTVEANEDEITSDYANNVYYLGTIWDLKLLFGELSSIKGDIDWHTSITLPWAAAKLMSYYLTINVAAHEAQSGPIKVPKAMLPPPPPPIREEDKNNESVKALIEFINETRKKFIAGSQ